ncbi:MAG: TIGR04283 family arsenosugar biosynthesis glycosyltransferase [Alphaproteobacteria bacterium]|nr:TIGR04283 family arsenosugar biosynthesis glycosyltransferase [Alphaproteobacteria bacterium]
MLSIVIPALDAEAELGATIAALAPASGLAREIVVADGGSADKTVVLAERLGARIVDSAHGRGRQLIAGAAAAKGDWLLFLHADTRLSTGWQAEVADFIAQPENAERVGIFRFVLDDEAAPARRLERIAGWRGRRLGLPYGDQGLLIARVFYDAIGGYRPLALMEDVALVRRIGRRRLIWLETAAVTSARRYREGGYLLRPARNLLCLALYFLGLPTRLIARLYA